MRVGRMLDGARKAARVVRRKRPRYVRAETAGMTREQQIEYWKRRSDEYRNADVAPKASDKRRAG